MKLGEAKEKKTREREKRDRDERTRCRELWLYKLSSPTNHVLSKYSVHNVIEELPKRGIGTYRAYRRINGKKEEQREK
jgi:hypothetical protein